MQKAKTAELRQRDVMDPARACAMQVALGSTPALSAGDALPPFFHQLYFWAPAPPNRLGRDGHPQVGGVIPDMGLPRRMWAGGRLAFHAPVRLGSPAERVTVCEDAVRKEGRTGPLAFVTLRHEIRQAGVLCVSEWQDLVYREDPDVTVPRPAPPVAPVDEEEAVAHRFDATVLFRYSALTFNGHRIHYDQPYAREVEGYDGLVVHGPLLAQHLMLMAEAAFGSLERFRFRATSPLLHHELGTFCRAGRRLWVRGPDGRMCMEAEA
ncbi:acyl dehydratase [uncultured Tateyamaria sp.]|uniref:FAS1-like dehydratase domain-containing protein n=1 Tax=uncultured Tateyamaria sp. TaxID=455651 RepID=UPI0026161967|nr:acyl dehydratase [uncultured Tateyamaria sp.]